MDYRNIQRALCHAKALAKAREHYSIHLLESDIFAMFLIVQLTKKKGYCLSFDVSRALQRCKRVYQRHYVICKLDRLRSFGFVDFTLVGKRKHWFATVLGVNFLADFERMLRLERWDR